MTILCAFFTAAAAEDLVAKVARGAELQRVIFSRHSSQLGYSRCLSAGRAGKLAAIVAFRGKGAKVQKAELAMTAQASIAFLLETGFFRPRLIISIWVAFKFLTAPCGMSFVFEGAQLKYVVAPLRRHILGCPWIDLRVRRMLALSLVLSKGRTTRVAWPTLVVRDYKKVQADFNNVWRGVLRANICAGSPHLSCTRGRS